MPLFITCVKYSSSLESSTCSEKGESKFYLMESSNPIKVSLQYSAVFMQ